MFLHMLAIIMAFLSFFSLPAMQVSQHAVIDYYAIQRKKPYSITELQYINNQLNYMQDPSTVMEHMQFDIERLLATVRCADKPMLALLTAIQVRSALYLIVRYKTKNGISVEIDQPTVTPTIWKRIKHQRLFPSTQLMIMQLLEDVTYLDYFAHMKEETSVELLPLIRRTSDLLYDFLTASGCPMHSYLEKTRVQLPEDTGELDNRVHLRLQAQFVALAGLYKCGIAWQFLSGKSKYIKSLYATMLPQHTHDNVNKHTRCAQEMFMTKQGYSIKDNEPLLLAQGAYALYTLPAFETAHKNMSITQFKHMSRVADYLEAANSK